MKSVLYRGDSVKVLKSFKDKSVDAIFVDPPYGIGLEYDGYVDSQENLKLLIDELMPEMLRVATVVAITPGIGNIRLYPREDWTLAWLHRGGAFRCPWGFNCWQPILVYGPDPYLTHGKGCRPDAFENNSASRKSDHPCPKPDAVMAWIVNRISLPGQTVLDPCMGSGTTGVQAVKLGRKFIGIEQSPKYFDIATKDIAAAEMQPLLMAEAAESKEQFDFTKEAYMDTVRSLRDNVEDFNA